MQVEGSSDWFLLCVTAFSTVAEQLTQELLSPFLTLKNFYGLYEGKKEVTFMILLLIAAV